MARSVTLAIYMAIEGLLMYAVLAMAMKMATRDGFYSILFIDFELQEECLRNIVVGTFLARTAFFLVARMLLYCLRST